MKARFAWMIVVSLAAVSVAKAQSADPHEQLIDLATIEALHDLCGFDLSGDQQNTVATRRQKLVDDGAVDESDIEPTQTQIVASLTRQVAEGLCRPDGAEAHLYKRKLSELGAP